MSLAGFVLGLFNFVVTLCEFAFSTWNVPYYMKITLFEFVLFLGVVVCHVKMLSTSIFDY